MAKMEIRKTKKTYTINQLQKKLATVFNKLPIYKAVLFGSYAKGNATENSDVDIMIDSRGQLKGFKFFGVATDIENALKKSVDLYEVHYLAQDSFVLKTALSEGVTIYERL